MPPLNPGRQVLQPWRGSLPKTSQIPKMDMTTIVRHFNLEYGLEFPEGKVGPVRFRIPRIV